MKRLIYKFSDSNMAGYSWSWEYYLTSPKRGRLTLTGRQIVSDDEPRRIDPRRGLRDGVDVYEALSAMIEEAGYSLAADDLPAIAREIVVLDADVAEQFSNGPELAEERGEVKKKQFADEREAILHPYREIIDNYVLKFSDDPLRYPGGMTTYGTRRGWAKLFIEDYVVANGRLPTGEHRIEIRGYSGGSHDFSDLK